MRCLNSLLASEVSLPLEKFKSHASAFHSDGAEVVRTGRQMFQSPMFGSVARAETVNLIRNFTAVLFTESFVAKPNQRSKRDV